MTGKPRFKMRVVIIFALLLFQISSITSAAEYQPLRVEPSRFIFEGNPGERFTGTIYVMNKGEAEADARAILQDWILDPDNKLVVSEEGSLDCSLSGRIKFNPRRFTIPPGKSQIVRFTVDIPRDMNHGEMRGMIAFEQTIPYEGDSMGATARIQVATTVYMTILPAVRTCEITAAQLVNDKENNRILVALNIEGTGTAHFRGKGSFRVFNPGGDTPIFSGEYNSIVVLPNTTIQFISTCEGLLEPGEYHVAITITPEEQGAEPIERVYRYTEKEE